MKKGHFLTIIIATLGLTSCNMAETLKLSSRDNSSIENKILLLKQDKITRNYQKCVEDGKKIDYLASQDIVNSKSLFYKSANILNKCEEIISNNNHLVNEEKRMKNFALSVQNFLKSGNISQARLKLKTFKNKFNKDLMYPDGSSFISNIEILVNYQEPKKELNLAMVNANKKIKNELKRAWHWSKK